MPRKTPKKSEVKTESTTNTDKPQIILLVLLAITVMVVAAFGFTFLRDKTVVLGDQRLSVTVSSTPAERERGLSGTEKLSRDQGMLFVFSDTGPYCFWMKDMSYPLDIIWLDQNKKAVSIQENATPDSYPKSFCPDKDAQYVIEVNAGSVNSWNLKVGDIAKF